MKTKSPSKVHLTRVLNGWYSFMRIDRKVSVSYTIVRQGDHLWSMTNDLTLESHMVDSLDTVREIIALELQQQKEASK